MRMNSPSFKFVIVGNSSVGKTTIINRYLNSKDNDTHSTIGVINYSVEKEIDGRFARMQIWDTAGQEQYRSIIPLYFRNAAVALIVFDLTERESFNKLESWVKLVNENAPKDILIVYIGNKTDLADQRVVEMEEISELTNEKNYFEVSALRGEGISDVFDFALRTVMDKKQEKQGFDDDKFVNTANDQGKSKCC